MVGGMAPPEKFFGRGEVPPPHPPFPVPAYVSSTYLAGDLTPFNYPKISEFINDTGRDIFQDGREAVRVNGAGKGPSQPENDLPITPVL